MVIEWRLYRSWALRSARALVSSLVNRKYQPSQHQNLQLSPDAWSLGRCFLEPWYFLSIARMIWHFWSSNLHRTVCCHTQLLISRYRVRCRSNFVFLTLRYFFLISFLVSIVSQLFLWPGFHASNRIVSHAAARKVLFHFIQAWLISEISLTKSH